MRTTLNIDDDVLAVARALAERNGCSLGSAVSELARRGIKGWDSIKDGDGFPAFGVFPAAQPITDDDVRKALRDWP